MDLRLKLNKPNGGTFMLLLQNVAIFGTIIVTIAIFLLCALAPHIKGEEIPAEE